MYVEAIYNRILEVIHHDDRVVIIDVVVAESFFSFSFLSTASVFVHSFKPTVDRS